MKRFIALVMVGVMAVGMSVMAAPSPVASSVAPVAAENSQSSNEYKAAQANLSVNEYNNNVIASTPGIPDAYQIGQGGNCIVNGVKSNARVTLIKKNAKESAAAVAQATAVGGTAIAYVGTDANCKFTTLGVNFYMPGIKAGDKIAVYQLVNGKWVKVTVNEIRLDHVVLTMENKGDLLFVKLAK